ncbi:MAG: hypothetical protein QNK23_01215 [Crocinitomicaceae bacterium]|nr:hypothetical protein [Crocinitomicaceae bacterium]
MKHTAIIIITIAFYLVGCTTDSHDDHGHDHGPDGEHLEEDQHGHEHDEDEGDSHDHHEQEDFIVEQDTADIQNIEEIEEHTHHDDEHDHSEHTHEH